LAHDVIEKIRIFTGPSVKISTWDAIVVHSAASPNIDRPLLCGSPLVCRYAISPSGIFSREGVHQDH
jgi:hypothetical protein